jgi:hypothetical protein
MTVVRHSRNRRFIGATFGRRGGPLYARVYDKTLEAGSDAAIRAAWVDAGYEPAAHGDTVWRVEFEARNALFSELQTAAGERLPTEDPEALLRDNLGTLWRYMAGEWLVLRAQDGRTRLERSAPRDWWAALAGHVVIDGQAGQLAGDLLRKGQPEPDSGKLLKQLVGILVSFGAANDTTSLDAVLDAACRYAEEAVGPDAFADKVRARLKKLSRTIGSGRGLNSA